LPAAPRPQEEGGHREVVRSGPVRGLESVDEVFLLLHVSGRFHPAGGVSLWSRARVFGQGSVFRSSWPGRVEDPRCGWRRLWRGRNPREDRPPSRGNPVWAGTDSQRDRGFEVGEAGGTWRFRCSWPRVTGKWTSVHGMGIYSRCGDPGDCVKAWESVKPVVIRTRVTR
jgi:hypothetical protein